MLETNLHIRYLNICDRCYKYEDELERGVKTLPQGYLWDSYYQI